MASRLPFNTEDFDKGCGCTLYPCQSQQSALNETKGERQMGRQQEYSDADFAREMQGLSVQERQRVTEDVHLVADQVQETEEFLNTKVKELLDVITNYSKKKVQRDAWDRALFLCPSLAKDRDHYLMFLRAKDYDAYDAAMLILKFYETKRRLWGDELLARRIGWDDLPEESRAVYKRCYCIFYFSSQKQGESQSTEIHRKGHIAIIDLRGFFKMSPFQYLDDSRTTVPMMESSSCGCAFSGRAICQTEIARSLQAVFGRNHRLRVTIHAGSWMEIQYSLRSYGIDIAADWLEGDVEGSPFSSEYIEATTQEYKRTEEERKRNEAPYCDPSSEFAMYPNPQDIIMGKNRIIAPSWPGNVAYTTLIHEYTASYGISTSRSEKTAMAKEILHRLKAEFQARFLNRKENVGWESATDEEARHKVSQSLRDEYRKILKTGTF